MNHANEFDLHVFLSSTFDEDVMRHAREAFRNEINARLNNIVGLLGGNTYIYDLQLGIPNGTDALRTLEICFDKIKQSDYFVFMLSEKTGNQNTRDFLKGHPGCVQSPYAETILFGQKEGLFIIELEVLEAEGNPKLKGKRIFFFDRKQSDKARSIADRVINTCSEDDLLLEFSNVNDIKESILSYFSNLVEAQTAGIEDDEKNSNLYSAGMLRYYVKNDAGIALLDDCLENNVNAPFILQGESGSGKSTLLADWLKDKPDVLAYHVGVNGYTLREMLSSLFQRYWPDLPEDVRSGDEKKLIAQFYHFLCILAQNGKKLLVLDGVNQLSTETPNVDKYMWLPHKLPEGIKLVISTTDIPSGHDDNIHEVPAVNLLDILKRILELEGKELETDTIEAALRGSPLVGQPLPILAHILYQEIAEKFNYANLADDLSAHLQSTRNAHDLYSSFIQRTAERFGGTLVKDALALIWCAKDGLRLEDLHGILQPDKPQKLDDLIYLLYHEFSRDSLGRMKFSHTLLAEVAEELYCQTTHPVRNRIIEYMNGVYEDDGQTWRLIEIVQQLFALGDSERMEAVLSHTKVAVTLYLHDATMFAQYYQLAKNHNELPFIWENSADRSDYREVSFVAFYFQKIAEYAHALHWRLAALQLALDSLGAEQYETAKTNNNIGYIYHQQGDYKQALRYHIQALEICESLGGDGYSYTGLTCDEIGKDYLELKNYDDAKRWLDRALCVLKSTLGEDHLYTARTYNDFLILYQELGDLTQAEQWGLRAVKAYETANKAGFPDGETAGGCLNLAYVYAEKNDFKSAYEYAKRGARILAQVDVDAKLLQTVQAFETQMLMCSLFG